MTCPSCGGELDPAQVRCPVCESGQPRVEGALAADPRFVTPPAKGRVERDIPGLRKKEKTWRDEVQERVRSRRHKRALAGLPLFEQAEAQEPDAPAASAEAPAAPELAEAAAEPAAAAETPASPELRTAEPPSTAALDGEPAAAGAHAELVTVRLSDAELGDLPLNADEAELASRAREDAVLPRATRRPMPSLDEAALVDEPEAEPDVELPPLETEAPPLERPAFAVERAQAAAVDAILFGALAVVVVYFTGRAARAPVTALAPSWPGLALYLGMLALFYAVYFTGTTGQTPGKLMLGLRVVGASGRPPSYGRALGRAFVGTLGIALAGSALVPMAFDPARRTLHDRLFRTRVVRH